MANLMDGIRKCGKSEIAKLYCHFKIHSMRVILQIIGQCIWFGMVFVWRILMKIFKKEVTLPKLYFWKLRFDRQYDSCMQMEDDVLMSGLIKMLKRKLRMVGRRAKKSEDRLSAEITKLVSGLYRGEALKGLSIPEKNDYIGKKYPSSKKLDERMCIRLWLVVSIFVFISGFIFFLSKREFRLLITATVILVEMVWWYFVFYKITQWQLARFIWVSFNGLGQSFSMNAVNTVKYDRVHDKEKQSLDYAIYHTLRNMRKQAVQKEEQMMLEALTLVREEWEKDKLKKKWEKCFPKLEYEDSIFCTVVNEFAYEDFKGIEKRYEELSQVKDPAALAEKKKSGYVMSFRTQQGDIGTLYFKAAKNSEKRLCITRIERRAAWEPISMSKDKLIQALKKEDYQIGEVYQTFLNLQIPKEQKLAGYHHSLDSMEKQISELEGRMQRREAERAKLSKQMDEKEAECQRIHGALAQRGLSDSEYEVNRQAFLKAQREQTTLKNDVGSLEKRIGEIAKEYDTLVGKKQALIQEVSLLNEQLTRLLADFTEEVKGLVEKKKADGSKSADYLLGEMLIRKYSR